MTELLDEECNRLGEGEGATKLFIDLAVAYAEDNGTSVDYALVTRQAGIVAAAKYICPQYADEAKTGSEYINLLRVMG